VQYLLIAEIDKQLFTHILSFDENAHFYAAFGNRFPLARIPIGLYDLQLHSFIMRPGDDTIDLEKNQDFLKHIVYAKFFDGQVSYSQQEMFILTLWRNSVGAEKLKEAFLYIIRGNPQKQNDFNRSVLKRVLE
jgi:hypothetical protein